MPLAVTLSYARVKKKILIGPSGNASAVPP